MQFETMQMQVLSNMITAVTIVAFYLSSPYIKRVKEVPYKNLCHWYYKNTI